MTRGLASAVFVACVFAWYAIRLPHERRARRARVAVNARGWREWVLMAIAGTGIGLLPGLYVAIRVPRFAEYQFVPALGWLGTAVFAGALWLFYRTHRDLGANWSVSLQVRESHRLVTEGVYRHVRHPMYAAFWLWAVAQALLLPNWIAGPAGLVGFGVLYAMRVGEEERLMVTTFGDEYRAYMRRTARLVPGLY